MAVVYREKNFLQAQTPGARDILVLEEGTENVGKSGGIKHFGFRLAMRGTSTAPPRQPTDTVR